MVLGLAILALSMLPALAAQAADPTWPSKPMRFVVPFPPGGGTDLSSRAVTQRIAKNTGWTFVVENKPGSGGNLGADFAAKSAPDGYTFVMGQTSNLAINPALYAKPPFDPIRDFAPVSLVSTVPLVIVGTGKKPWRTLGEVMAAAKGAPDRVSYASPGNGTVAHLAGELLARSASVKLLHVPYKGASPALTDLVGGQVDLYISTPGPAAGHVKSGAIHALAVTSPKRVAAMPQVPSVAEAGLAGAVVINWYGVLAPAGTPAVAIERMNAEIQKALQAPEVREALAGEGGEVLGGTPAHFAEFLRAERDKWARIVKDSGAKVD